MLDVRIDGLPQFANGRQIELFLQRYGQPLDIEIFRGSEDSFAFVLFESESTAESAIRELDDSEFHRSGYYVRVGKRGGPMSHGLPVRSRDERPELPRSNVLSIKDRDPPSRDRQTPRSRSRPAARPAGRQGDEFIAWMGGLPAGVQEREIEDFCRGYGKILAVRLRSSKIDTFAFVTFEDPASGDRFVKDMDQSVFSSAAGKNKVQIRESVTRRPERDIYRHRSKSREKKFIEGRSRIKVHHLPPDMSWRELKDIGREFGGDSIEFANVKTHSDGDTIGILEYDSRDHAEAAVRGLHGKRVDGSTAKLEVTWD